MVAIMEKVNCINDNYWSKQSINKRLFTTNYNSLISTLKQVSINPNNPIPVELVKELVRLIDEINKLENPIFTENNLSVMESYWKEFKFIGLNNVDYIKTNFYKEGYYDSFN